MRAERLQGDLRQNVRRLEPLTVGAAPRELVVATQDPSWVAVFDCGANGGDPESTVGHLARTMGVEGVTVVSDPRSPVDGGGGAARQFQIFAPDAKNPLGSLRAISVVQDGRRWEFDAIGEVQPFEDTDAYTRRRVPERFTQEMLAAYARAMGLRPFDGDFFCGPCVLIENGSARHVIQTVGTIEEAQRRWRR